MFEKTKKSLRIYMIVAMASIIFFIAFGFLVTIYFVNEKSERESIHEILRGEVNRVENSSKSSINKDNRSTIPPIEEKPKMIEEKNNFFFNTNPRRMYITLLEKNNGEVEKIKINIPFEEEREANFQSLILLVDGKKSGQVVFENSYYIFDSEEILQGQLYVFIDSSVNKRFFNISVLVGLLVVLISVIYIWLLSIKITNKALYPLKLSVESQLRFSSDASHELRTPLTAMRTNMDILMEYDDLEPNEQKRWLNNISKEIDRMSKLTNDLLKLSRNNTVDRAMKEFYSTVLVDYIKFMYESVCCLEFDVEEFIIYGNEEDLKQLLIIFIDNGLKYNNSENKIIKFTMLEKEKNYIFKIKDNGIGIKNENFEKIFERFFREDESRSRNDSSIGLGLSIGKNIINYYNGNVNVSSVLNKYTEFVISLPIIKKRIN